MQDFKLKEQFNYFKNNPLASNLKSIENLVEHNESLAPILTYFKKTNSTYLNSINDIKKELMSLTEFQYDMHLKNSYLKIKELNKSFEMLNNQIKNFNKYSLDTDTYSNNATNISLEIMEIINELQLFSKANTNILVNYESQTTIFKTLNNQITKNVETINTKLIHINSTELYECFKVQVEAMVMLWKITNNFFNVDCIKSVSSVLIELIQKMSNEFHGSEIDGKKIAFEVANTKTVIYQVDKLLHDLKFDDAINLLKEQLLKLENIKMNMESEINFNKLYEKTLATYKTNVEIFNKILKQKKIGYLYSKIITNYEKDYSILSLTENNINSINFIEACIKKLNEKKKRKYSDIFNIIKDVYTQILTLKKDNLELLNLIKSKTINFITLSHSIADYQIKLKHILFISTHHKIVYQNGDLLHYLHTYSKELKDIQEKLKLDYNKYYEKAKKIVQNIETFIEVCFDSIYSTIILNCLYQILSKYANRYYTDINKGKIDEMNLLFKQNKVELAIEEFLSFLNKQKKLKKVS